MKTIAIGAIISLLAVFLLPSAKKQLSPVAEDYVLLVEQTVKQPEETQTERTVSLLDGATLRTLSEKEYLTQVVLSEMPSDFHAEAMKAQAIAARTFLRKHTDKHENADICSDSHCCQAWTSKEKLREKLADRFEKAWDKASSAVSETDGEVLLYQDELIDAVFFSCTGGKTEAAIAVWGSDVPYLQSVDSYGETQALRYQSTNTVSEEEFKNVMSTDYPEIRLSSDPQNWLGEATYTQGGGVAQMKIGDMLFSGTELRRLFGLNSTQFTAEYQNGQFVFSVLGFGHRVGMSQYGAEYMAQNGYDAAQILRYYYRGTQIKKLP